MGVLRNFIDISGITSERDLPDIVKGQLLEYSEVEHFHIPDDKPDINNIYQISVNIELLSTRTINAPLGRIVVLDGVKKFKIVYTGCSEHEMASIVDVELPFNTFVDIPKEGSDINNVNIFIADAYFKAIDSRKLYSFILYIIDIAYDKAVDHVDENRKIINITGNENIKILNYNEESIERMPEIKMVSQVLSEMSLSKVSSKVETSAYNLKTSLVDNTYDLETSLVDIDSEYL